MLKGTIVLALSAIVILGLSIWFIAIVVDQQVHQNYQECYAKGLAEGQSATAIKHSELGTASEFAALGELQAKNDRLQDALKQTNTAFNKVMPLYYKASSAEEVLKDIVRRNAAYFPDPDKERKTLQGALGEDYHIEGLGETFLPEGPVDDGGGVEGGYWVPSKPSESPPPGKQWHWESTRWQLRFSAELK